MNVSLRLLPIGLLALLLCTQVTNAQEHSDLDSRLFQTISFGNVLQAAELLDQGANIHAKGEEGRTPLHLAVRRGNVDLVQLLIQEGAELDARDERGRTPLLTACTWMSVVDDPQVVQCLVEAGARIDLTDNWGTSPCRTVARKNKHLYDWLIEHAGGKEPPRALLPIPPEIAALSSAELVSAVTVLKPMPIDFQPALRELLRRGDATVEALAETIAAGNDVSRCADLLVELGPTADPLIPLLVDGLNDKRRVFSSLWTLRFLDPQNVHQSNEVRRIAADKMAEEIQDRVRAVDDQHSILHQCKYLVLIGEPADPVILRMLRADKASTRFYAVSGLESATSFSADIEAQLIEMLETDADPGVRSVAAQRLRHYGPPNQKAKTALLNFVREARYNGVVFPPVVNAGDPWTAASRSAAASLGRYGPEIIDDLIPLLTPPNEARRLCVIVALKHMGESHLAALIELLEHENALLADAAASALGQLNRPGNGRPASFLKEIVLRNREPATSRAVRALSIPSSDVPDAQAFLLEVAAAEQYSAAARLAAVDQLLWARVELPQELVDQRVIPAAVQVLQVGTWEEREFVTKLLRRMGPIAKGAVPVLREFASVGADTPDQEWVKQKAAAALEEIERPPVQYELPVFQRNGFGALNSR